MKHTRAFNTRASSFRIPHSAFGIARLGGHPFSRSYGAILQSSLERFLSRAWEYSSHPPVSVYGTGRQGTFHHNFSRQIVQECALAEASALSFDDVVPFLSASSWR